MSESAPEPPAEDRAHRERQADEEPRPEGRPPAESVAPAPETVEAESGDRAAQEGGDRVADVVEPATVRRAPRYGRFVLLGILLGAVGALLLSLLPLGSSALSTWALFWVLFLILGFFGGVLGAVVALVLDRRSLRRRDARMAQRGTAAGPDRT